MVFSQTEMEKIAKCCARCVFATQKRHYRNANADAIRDIETARLVLCQETRDDECWVAVKPVLGF